MRYLTWIRHPENAGAPPQALNDAMIKFVERSYKSGALVDTGGLAATKDGFRIRMSKGKLKTTDGPFTETKEIVGGYAIINANSREEAYKIANEFMELHRVHWPEFEGESEVRQIMDLPRLDHARQ
ncbi:MAG TPA: YciI family protein [Gemmatimonadaceae bacterium]